MYDPFYWLDRELDRDFLEEKERNLKDDKKRINENGRNADITNGKQ